MSKNEEMSPSAYLIRRLRLMRTTRQITQKKAAAGITAAGYPITTANLSMIERGGYKKLPYDFVTAAAAYFCADSFVEYRLGAFLYGPLCESCHDDPPNRYICRSCRRYRNDEGEVVPC